jgi:NADPH2:quinone reductase
VIASVRSADDVAAARRAGAHHVLHTGDLPADQVLDLVRSHAPEGIDHVVEVAFHSNILVDERLLRQGGSIAAYATDAPAPTIPFWPLVFKNVHLFFLGSDDFPAAARTAAASALNEALAGAWPGLQVGVQLPLEAIARAHEAVETRTVSGRVVVSIAPEGGAA